MEEHLNAKIKEIASSESGVTGVMIVDRYGLPIERYGSLSGTRSGIISSIMKNVAQISQIIQNPSSGQDKPK